MVRWSTLLQCFTKLIAPNFAHFCFNMSAAELQKQDTFLRNRAFTCCAPFLWKTRKPAHQLRDWPLKIALPPPHPGYLAHPWTYIIVKVLRKEICSPNFWEFNSNFPCIKKRFIQCSEYCAEPLGHCLSLGNSWNLKDVFHTGPSLYHLKPPCTPTTHFPRVNLMCELSLIISYFSV